MNEAQEKLLGKVLASRQFANAHSLKRILLYICGRSDEPESLKEYEIAVGALGRPESFDPKTDPIVRVSIAGIRERLRAYFETEGAQDELRLSIPKGEYRASFVPAPIALQEESRLRATAPTLARFWRPYLGSNFGNILLYNELLFFRDDSGNYVRNIYVNDEKTGNEEIRRRIPCATGTYRPSYHFLSAGEVHAMLSIASAFRQLETEIELKNARFSAWNELQRANLVILGSSRTNSFVDSLQGEGNFIVTPDRIVNRNPQPGEEECYQGKRFMEGKLERVVEYAVVTRRPGLTPGSAITMVSANHGRAIEGAGQFVSLEDKLSRLFERIVLGDRRGVPDHFQLLLRLEMIDFDEEVINVEYLTHRILS